MDNFGRITALKLQAACDRTDALAAELGRVENRIYSSPASRQLIAFISDAAKRIRSLLDDESRVIEQGLLTHEEIESRLNRATRLIPYLHKLIGYIDRSDVAQAPGQLVQPLRRYLRRILPNADVIVSAKPALNYTIEEIARPLRDLFEETGFLAESCTLLPQFLFAISIPVVESEQILIHAILAHELGHPLYDHSRVGERLLAEIQIPWDLVHSLAATMCSRMFAP